MIGVLFGWIMSLLMGGVVVYGAIPRRLLDRSSIPIFVLIAIGLGIATASFAYFVRMIVPGWQSDQPLMVDAAFLFLLMTIAAAIRRSQSGNPGSSLQPQVDICSPSDHGNSAASWLNFWLIAVLAVVAIFAAHAALTIITKRPHGQWDAWAIWDLRARFLYRAAAEWQLAYAPILNWSHLDYPLLLPASVARNWSYAGAEDFNAPAIMAVTFMLLVPLLLLTGLAWLRGLWIGALGALLLVSSGYYIRLGASFCADVPLSFYILGATICGAAAVQRSQIGASLFALAGFMAGCGAWTKNEGLLFCFVFPVAACAAALIARKRQLVRTLLRAYVYGAALPLLVVAIFKLFIAGRSDLFSGPSGTVGKIFDPERHKLILSNAFSIILGQYTGLSATGTGISIAPLPTQYLSGHFNGLALIVAMVGVILSRWRQTPREAGAISCERFQFWFVSLLLLLMSTGFYLIYLITPYNLNWHITTSMHRLILQLWPAGLFLLMLMFPSDWVSREPKAGDPLASPQSPSI